MKDTLLNAMHYMISGSYSYSLGMSNLNLPVDTTNAERSETEYKL